MNQVTARLRVLGAPLAAAVAAAGLVACGQPDPALPTASCALIPDLSTSATPVVMRASQVLTEFVTGQGCASVQVVPITANSSGEACTSPAVDLLDLTAAPDNPVGRRTEIEDEKVPLILRQVATLNECVTANGTGNGTDVIGAFRQADKLANGNPVVALVVSDLVHNVGLDLLGEPVDTGEQRTALAEAVAQQLPDLSGWSVTAAGAAAGTTDLTPAQSDAVQGVWEQAVRQRGGSWHRVSV
ncbi:hypothetical protein [Rhodococcus ruber]|uniref:hypothetical protein n=1 Tax=Rhodococcus ruber TaxID=1830 RepID=UPI000C7BC2C1|nr:hypothetical protein [Rhodococcus ruber]AUM20263.1 hypothetical protein CSW53_27240 [Rhodococcus ruber]